jgi:hypothetical protein
MIIEFNKFNIILFYLSGVTITLAFKRWIYGILILLLSTFILIQRIVLKSGNPAILKYQNITMIPSIVLVIAIIFVSLFILAKSSIDGTQKLLSIVFLLGSLGFSVAKKYFKDKPLFNLDISNYIASALFMVVLVTISIIPDNQEILESEYRKYKSDTVKTLT